MRRILFDQNVPVPLRRIFSDPVSTAFELGWAELENGALIAAAEQARFDVFITADKNIRHQQNLRDRRIALIVPGTNDWDLLQIETARILLALDAAARAAFRRSSCNP